MGWEESAKTSPSSCRSLSASTPRHWLLPFLSLLSPPPSGKVNFLQADSPKQTAIDPESRLLNVQVGGTFPSGLSVALQSEVERSRIEALARRNNGYP